MNIVADENIARVEVFRSLGNLITLPGREINAEVLREADALLVRSVTKVNEDLLRGTAVKFVASATSGIDHVATSYLARENVAFSYAPGCNARSVVEYVFSALTHLSAKGSRPWQQSSFGIIGAGNIGGLLARYLQNLDIEYSIYDPFLTEGHEHGKALVSFEEVLEKDVLTIHTPLTMDGEFPTFHLFDRDIINALSPGKILINAARGGVVDNKALLARLALKGDINCVLDAWESEPNIVLPLLSEVALGTPHIAGYSLNGKLMGTEMIYRAFCDFFNLDKAANNSQDLDSLQVAQISGGVPDYDIFQDHLNMQSLLQSAQPGQAFDLLRKNYPVRLEYSAQEILPIC